MYACMHVCVCVISAMSSLKKKRCVPTQKQNTISNIYYSYFFFFSLSRKRKHSKTNFFLLIFYFSVYGCLARQAYGRVKERKMRCLWTHSAWERKVVQLTKKKKHPLFPTAIPKKLSVVRFFFLMLPYFFFSTPHYDRRSDHTTW